MNDRTRPLIGTRAAEIADWQWLRPKGSTTHPVGNRYTEFVEKLPQWEALFARLERERNRAYEIDQLLEQIREHLGAPSPVVGQIVDLFGPHDLCVLRVDRTFLRLRHEHLQALRTYMVGEGKAPLETILPTIYHPWKR